MKQLFTIILLFTIHVSFTSSYAQNARAGFINFKTINSLLPDIKLAEQELSALSKQAEEQIKQKRKIMDDKFAAHYKPKSMQESAALTDAQKEAQRVELSRESENFQTFVSQKEGEIKTKREKLYADISEKIRRAVAEVATEKGYSCIMDVSTLVFYQSADDITTQVLNRLNVK